MYYLIKLFKVLIIMIPVTIYRLIHLITYFSWNFKLPERFYIQSLITEEKGADYGYVSSKYYIAPNIFDFPLFSKTERHRRYKSCLESWSTGANEPENLFFCI